jgi:hypothetical protein
MTSSHFGVSEEEGEEERKYVHQKTQTFPGSQAWLNRLNNLQKSVDDFSPSEMKYLNFSQSSAMSELRSTGDNGLQFCSVPHSTGKAWYEETRSADSGVGHGTQSSFSSQFITGIHKHRPKFQEVGTSKQNYESHCFLPAVLQEHDVTRVDFVSGLLIAYYGEGGGAETGSQVRVAGMVIYSMDSRSYSYIR